MDYSKLTYAVQKKTDMVCKLKKEKAKWKLVCELATGVNILLIVYILLNNRFTYYTTTALRNENLVNGIKTFDLTILIIFAVVVLIIFCTVFQYMELQEYYEEVRRDIMESVNHKICTCKGECVCKDEYIKDMKGKGIILSTSRH